MENRITSKRANNILHSEFFSKFTHIQRLCYKISDANYSCLNITCLLGFRKCRTLKRYFRIIFPTVIIKVKSVIRTILLDFFVKITAISLLFDYSHSPLEAVQLIRSDADQTSRLYECNRPPASLLCKGLNPSFLKGALK